MDKIVNNNLKQYTILNNELVINDCQINEME